VKYFKITILFTFIAIISCKESSTDPNNDLAIEVNSNGDKKDNLFDIVSINEVVQFQGFPENQFEFITYGEKYKGNYYLMTSKYEGKLYITDSDGNFKNVINNKGKGPFEYRQLTSFSIDKKNDELYLHDFEKQFFHVYDLDGNFIRIVPTGFNFLAFCFHEDLIYLFPAKHENYVNETPFNYDIIIVNRDFEIVGNHLPFDVNKFRTYRAHKQYPFYKSNDSIYFNDLLSDTIYQLKNSSLEKIYVPKYINKTLSQEFRNKPHSEMFDEFRNNPQSYTEFDLLFNLSWISSSHIVTQFANSNMAYHNFKSLKTGRNYNYVFPEKYRSNVKYQLLFQPISTNGEKFTSLVYPYILDYIRDEYMLKYDAGSDLIMKIDSILANTIPDGNQVMVEFEFKNF